MVWAVTFACLAAYCAGLVLFVKITPGVLKRAYDEALFIGVAAGAIFGAMLAFGSIGVTFALFGGSLGIRIFDGLLLVILGVVCLRTSLAAYRPRYGIGIGTYRASRIMAGSFFLALTVACAALLILLFQIG